MRRPLKDFYVTSKKIADHWNAQGYPGPLKDGRWDGDAVSRKLRRILERLEEHVNADDKSRSLRELYLSKWNGGRKGEWVFFDTSEMVSLVAEMETVDSLEEGGFAEVRKFHDAWLPYYDAYGMDTYEPMNTYDTMKRIFDLCDSKKYRFSPEYKPKSIFLTCAEKDELKQRLWNLLPWLKNIDELEGYVKNEDVDSWKELLEGFAKNCRKIEFVLEQEYLGSRDDIFFEKRLYDGRESVKEAQFGTIKKWCQTWLYVMDQIVRVRKDEERFHFDRLPVRQIVECAILWWLKEGTCDAERKECSTEKDKTRDAKRKEYDAEKDGLQQCKEWIFEFPKHELREAYPEDYHFVICEAFWDLEQIYEYMAREGWDWKENEASAYLRAVHASIDIIHPTSKERISMIPTQ